VCRHVSLEDCRTIARRAIRMSEAKNIQDYVKNSVQKIAPTLFGAEM
jgi:hypothetical protein